MAAEFRNRSAQLWLAISSGIAAVIGLAMLTSPDTRVPGLLFAVVWGAVAFRALRASSVVVREDDVEIRSIVRTKRHRLADVGRVEVAYSRLGLYGSGREYLVFLRTDGRQESFMELNCRPPRDPDGDSVVRQAAAHINDRLGGRPDS